MLNSWLILRRLFGFLNELLLNILFFELLQVQLMGAALKLLQNILDERSFLNSFPFLFTLTGLRPFFLIFDLFVTKIIILKEAMDRSKVFLWLLYITGNPTDIYDRNGLC